MAYVIGFVGRSNSGKTTLITKIIKVLQSKGLRVGVIKHDAHGHYKMVENTDSTLYMNSGADAVVLSGPAQVVRFEAPQTEPSLEQLIAGMPELDIVLVEGYKKSTLPKIVVFLHPEQVSILTELHGDLLAIISGFPYEHTNMEVPVYGIDDSLEVTEFLCEMIRKSV